MAWQDRLLRGSFRGARFDVRSHDSEPGARRVQVHEYPGRDESFAEDLGRKAGRFEIDAYVLGDGYAARRDQLVAACGRSGAGVLIHPYLGVRHVACTSCTVSERSSEGRMARFALTFVAAGRNALPLATIDPAAAIADAARLAANALAAQFARSFGL